MLPDLSVLLSLLLGLLALAGSTQHPLRALLGSGLCLVIGGALSRMAVARGLKALDDADLLAAKASARWTMIWPFLAWLSALGFFEWGALVSGEIPRTWWIVRYLVLLAPALLVFAVGWAGRARLEAGLITSQGGVSPPSPARAGVRRGLARNSIIFIPLAVVIALTEGLWLAGELGVESLRAFTLWREGMPLLDILLMLALMLLALPFIPRIFARVLKSEPLEPGRLRDVLERAADSVQLKTRNIMVWRTGGRGFNAMVVGFTGRTRLIFLTDGLMSALTEDEILAVFFHEAGHAKRNHLVLFLVSFFSLSLLFEALSGPLAAIGIPYQLQIPLHLGVIWFGLLGWVSRRFERESDIYGAEHAALLDPEEAPLSIPGLAAPLPRGAALMMRALERIRRVVGPGGSHRHGSVEDRINYVAMHATDPEVRRAFARMRRRILLGIAALLVASVALTVRHLPTGVAQAEAHVASADGFRAYERAWRLDHSKQSESRGAASAKWREAYEAFSASAKRLEAFSDPQSRLLRMHALMGAADTALHGTREPELARGLFRKALALLKDGAVEGPIALLWRFQVHVELGRLAAWAYAALPPGDEGRDLGETLAHLEQADALLRSELSSSPYFSGPERVILDERLRLLRATYEGARGETAVARKALGNLAQLDRGSTDWEKRGLIEVAEDARLELQRLARPGR